MARGLGSGRKPWYKRWAWEAMWVGINIVSIGVVVAVAYGLGLWMEIW